MKGVGLTLDKIFSPDDQRLEQVHELQAKHAPFLLTGFELFPLKTIQERDPEGLLAYQTRALENTLVMVSWPTGEEAASITSLAPTIAREMAAIITDADAVEYSNYNPGALLLCSTRHRKLVLC